MKMIWGIFKRDMCHATRNVIAVIVSMGLVVVPALYAWFNIAASWDPYGNTKALKVAVANNDKGYKSISYRCASTWAKPSSAHCTPTTSWTGSS